MKDSVGRVEEAVEISKRDIGDEWGSEGNEGWAHRRRGSERSF